MKKRIALLLAIVMLFTLCLVGCGGDGGTNTDNNAGNGGNTTNTGGTPTGGGNTENGGGDDVYRELTVGAYGSTWAGLVDGAALDAPTNAYGIYNLVYDCMFQADADGNIVSDVFEDWSWSDDYLTLTCKLYDNITFSNGDKMTGEDVLYSVERKQNSPTGGWYRAINVAESTVSDDGLTVNLKYDYVYGVGTHKLNIYVMDKSFVEGLGESPDWYDPANIVGSGPYKVTGYTKDSSVTFEKRDDYWGALDCDADKITVNQYTDQTTMMIDLESGALDIAINTSEVDSSVALAGGIDNVALDLVSSNAVAMLVMSDESEVLQDIRVREAICHAIDSEAVADAAFGVLGIPATSSYASGLTGYKPGYTYTYDPALAMQILADAGYGDGDINLKYYVPNTTDKYAIAVTVQGYLKDVGINLTIDAGDMATVLGSYREPGNEQITDFTVMHQMDGIPDGEPWFSIYVYGANYVFPQAGMQNEPELQEYLDVLEHQLDENARLQASANVQQYLYDHFICVPIAEVNTGVGYRTDTVVAPHINSNIATNLRYVDMV